MAKAAPRKPPPLIAQVFAALAHYGVEFSRDAYGGLYMAVPSFTQTDLYRVSLGSADAPLLIRQVWGAVHTIPGEERPAVGLSNAAMGTVLGEARARASLTPKRRHYRRVAAFRRHVVLDCGAGWEAIGLSARGWKRLDRPPEGVNFLRSPSCRPYPIPRHVDAAKRARAFAEFQSFYPGIRGDRFCLLLVVLAWSLASERDHWMVLLYGPEGAGKSTLARMIRDLVDPSDPPLATMPDKDAVRNLMTAGAHSHVLAIDNASGLDRATADMLCHRLDGGAGQFRAHYTDSDVATVPSVGPGLMTAITALLEFADLASRILALDMRGIEEAHVAQLAQPDMQAKLDALRPVLFGCLLDIAVAGRAGAGKFEPIPGDFRGAQFGKFAQACAHVVGESPAAMAAMITDLNNETRKLVTLAAPVAAALIDMVTALRRDRERDAGMLGGSGGPVWTGTATELLAELGKANPMARSDNAFPKNGARVQDELKRLKLVLAAHGVRVVERRTMTAAHSPAGHARWLEVWDTPPDDGAPASMPDYGSGAPSSVARH